MTLTDFLLARIAEDEAAAEDFLEDEARARDGQYGGAGQLDWRTRARGTEALGWTPARVLAECEAKREVLAAYADHLQTYRDNPTQFGEGQRFGLLVSIGYLTTAYADHPDYREEWRP